MRPGCACTGRFSRRTALEYLLEVLSVPRLPRDDNGSNRAARKSSVRISQQREDSQGSRFFGVEGLAAPRSHQRMTP